MLPIFYSDEFLDHDTGVYHPEKPGRLTAITKALKAAPWADQLDWRSPTPIHTQSDRLMAALEAIHPQQYIAAVQQLANRGGGYIDQDTIVSPRSYDVALLAASAWLDGIDQTLATGEPAFVLARPPGHHAMPQRGMGFCIFANAAIAAHYALQQPGVNRVAILDWDVHHGNGTQAIAENHAQIAYCSLHQSPFYPGTGDADERGAFNNVLNLPMQRGSTLADYQPLFEQKVIPFLSTFQPDLLIVSAGYDATRADPLAEIALQPEDYGVFTRLCLQITRRTVFGLEGGYDFDSLSQSVVATVSQCL
ncbi:histone deacetylase [Cyanobacteria bacterium FACHB-471]|nr:histone deacetylase [Cyanobacteria bacterium FACHB-471]